MKTKYALFLWTIRMVYDAVSRGIPPLFGWEVSIGQSHNPDSPAPAIKLKQCNMIRKLEARLGIAIDTYFDTKTISSCRCKTRCDANTNNTLTLKWDEAKT
jgi:hypothetical protein